MLAAPLMWVVRAISVLPAAIRPGVFLSLVGLVLWLLVVRWGIAGTWNAACRGFAYLVNLVLGLVLLPEYAVTRSRRRRGQAPWPVAVAAGHVTDQVRASAVALYDRHPPPAGRSRRPPWSLLLCLALVPTLLWLVMHTLSVTTEAKYSLSDLFQHWRDVEAWADVPPDRRAARGAPTEPRPAIASAARHGDEVRVRLRCLRTRPCVATLVARGRSGDAVASKFVAVPAGHSREQMLTVPRGTLGPLEVHVKRR